MNPSIQHFNRPMMYSVSPSPGARMINPSVKNIPNEPMGYNVAGAGNVWMDFPIVSPLAFASGRYGGLVTGPNGMIYGPLPYKAAPLETIKIDTTTNTIIRSNIGVVFPTGVSSTRRFVLTQANTMIGIPAFGTKILEFNIATEALTSFASVLGTTGNNAFWGGVLAPNGKIYCPPYNGTVILVIDPVAKTTSSIGSFGSGAKWGAPVLAPNGKIYCPPFADSRVLVIDPNNDTFYYLKDDINNVSKSVYGTTLTTSKYQGATLAYDGKIYCVPYSAGSMLIIDPETDTVDAIPSAFGFYQVAPSSQTLLGTQSNFASGILGTNGKIYIQQYTFNGTLTIDAARIREFDPYTRTYSSIATPVKINSTLSNAGSAPFCYGGCALAPDGRIFYSAAGSNYFATINGLPPAVPEMFTLPNDLSKLPTSLYNLHSNGNGAV